MVMDRCKALVRTEAEACAWLTEQVLLERLKLSWTERSAEYPYGKMLYLDGADLIYVPSHRDLRALDQIDWRAGQLRRRLRAPKPAASNEEHPDPFKMSDDEAVACYGFRSSGEEREPKEWITDELTYPFTVQRASLSAILDTVSRDIPVADRAEGEPGECGCWRDSAEEQETAQTAPDILAAYRAKMRGLPRLMEERRRSFEGGSLVFVNHDCEAAIKTELRAPLKEHFDRQLRAGKWICHGFSEERGERVRIGSPWRDGLSFDDVGGLTDKRGGRYSDVLFYRAAELPRDPILARPQPAPLKPLLLQSEKAKLRHQLKDFLERETRIDPPQARTKAEWLQSARKQFGADLVTDNLFEEVWREADLPGLWRAPGRRT